MATAALYALVSVAVVSTLPLIFGSVFLAFRNADRLVFIVVSVSVGALFGDAFLHLIPESFATLSATRASGLILLGILFLFILEKFMHWHHAHGEEEHAPTPECAHHILPVGPLSLTANIIHNAVDGAIITGAYLADMRAGIATTVAVILHEIPHEVGSIGILMHAGFTKSKALLFTFYAAVIAMFGAGLTLVAGGAASGIVENIIPFAAGNFIYIAGSDLVPELHKTKHAGKSALQLIAIIAGIGLMALLLFTE